VLDPVDRSGEVLFGLIVALTFTTTFEVATAGAVDVRTMLIGALGCNLAWGLVDGVLREGFALLFGREDMARLAQPVATVITGRRREAGGPSESLEAMP
jgi:hypothetical protein